MKRGILGMACRCNNNCGRGNNNWNNGCGGCNNNNNWNNGYGGCNNNWNNGYRPGFGPDFGPGQGGYGWRRYNDAIVIDGCDTEVAQYRGMAPVYEIEYRRGCNNGGCGCR